MASVLNLLELLITIISYVHVLHNGVPRPGSLMLIEGVSDGGAIIILTGSLAFHNAPFFVPKKQFWSLSRKGFEDKLT